MDRLTNKELYNGIVCFTKCAQTNCTEKCGFCEVPKEAAEKLKEYEDLEEKGILLKLPCEFGSTVYVKMQFGGYAKAEVRDFIYFHSCGFCVVVTSDKFDKQNIPFSEFGKTIFLNNPEDEQKGQEVEKMKKVKIELPIRTYSEKIASVILYADMDVDLIGENRVKTILPPKITVVGESEAAAGEET